jgi:hypothetical protein
MYIQLWWALSLSLFLSLSLIHKGIIKKAVSQKEKPMVGSHPIAISSLPVLLCVFQYIYKGTKIITREPIGNLLNIQRQTK